MVLSLLDDVISNIAIYADSTTLCSKCYWATDLWQEPELASELDSDLRDTVEQGSKWLVDFNAGKTQRVSFGWSDKTGAIDVKMGRSVLKEKSSFKIFFTFSSKLDCCSRIISIAKTASKNIAVVVCSVKCLPPEVTLYFYKATQRPCMEYCSVQGSVTWNRQISYKNGYQDCWSFTSFLS